MAGSGFLSLTGASAAADLGVGMNPAAPANLSEDEIKKRKKQLDLLSQAQRGNIGQTPGINQGASLSLLGG